MTAELKRAAIQARRVVIVNDDGIDAPGLAILEAAAKQHCDDVWTVAPATNQSGKSRAMTHRGNVRTQPRGPNRFAVHGTPTDCILVALGGLLPGRAPDLVLSGVNAGGNLADDIFYSGTVGACMEATEQGIQAIAFSQNRGEFAVVDWQCAQSLLPDLLPRLVGSMAHERTFLNVNFPGLTSLSEVAGVRVVPSGWRLGPTRLTEQDASPGERVFNIDPLRGERPNEAGCDLDLCLRGYVTVTPLGMSLSRHDALESFQSKLGAEER